MKNFTVNPFFTDIAQGYNPKILEVDMCEFEQSEQDGTTELAGCAIKYHEGYLILIDRRKLQCPTQMLYILFHEIAHINMGHLDCGKISHLMYSQHEYQADKWATEGMHMLNVDGSIDLSENAPHCFPCCQFRRSFCSKNA